NSILNQQSRVATIGKQIASGERIVTPADDPRAAAQSLIVSQELAVNSQYKGNRVAAQRYLETIESELQIVTDTYQAIKPELVQALNGTLTDDNLHALANGLQGLYHQLLASANAQDGNGNYLF